MRIAAGEKALEEVLATEDHLRNSLFSDQPRVRALICEYEGQLDRIMQLEL